MGTSNVNKILMFILFNGIGSCLKYHWAPLGYQKCKQGIWAWL